MIRELLFRRRNWDDIAVIEGGMAVSYGDLARRGAQILQSLPDEPGKTVAVFLPNGWEYIAALFGTLMSGRTALPVGVQLTVHEIIPLLKQASAGTVITSTAFSALFKEISDNVNGGLQIIYVEELGADEAPFPVEGDIDNNEAMVLLSTSGTTSGAKLVRLSDENVETAVMGYLTYIDYDRFDQSEIRYILAAPFSTVYGLLILSACLIKSFPIVVAKGVFKLDTLYRAAQESKVTHYEGGTAIPLLMDRMAGRPANYDINSLKFVGFGGSKVSAEALKRLADNYPGIEFCQGYGMTESAALIARHYKRMHEHRFASVGTAIPGVTIKVEADGVLTNAPFVTGEIAVKGPNVMLGYLNNDEATKNAVQSGYLYTGDMGYLDGDGYLYICGRKKNVIMVRGFSVFAEEVEDCLLNSGFASECAVYGGTDSFGNEVVCADIVLDDPQAGTDDIRLYCAEHLADYKQPQRIRIVDMIKKTATGKVER